MPLRGAIVLLAAALSACALRTESNERWVLADAERFAALMDARGGLPNAAALRDGYLAPGSEGITIFTPHRIRDADHLARAVERRPLAYRKARELCLPVARRLRGEVEAAMLRIGMLLGRSDPTRAYVVFGAGNSGGTADARGLVLGLEVICADASTEEDAARLLRAFVLHETTHVHQARVQGPPPRDTLLRQVLVEGFADHMMTVARGDGHPADVRREAYGRANEAALWQAIQRDWDRDPAGTDWLYRQPARPGMPPDMGYWIGQQICEAYVARSADPARARRELLELRDPAAILAASGYAPAPGR